MNRIILAGLAVASCLAAQANAQAPRAAVSSKLMAIRVAPLPERVATADAVVVGKVTEIEEKTVKATRFPGDKEKGEFQVAVVKVEEALAGAKGVTHVRVAFPVQAAVAPGGPIRPGIRRGPPAKLDKDQEVCLFLAPHPEESFYALRSFADVLNKTGNPDFDKELAEVRKSAKLLADPKKGLTSGSAEDRFQTAALLVARYRTARPSAKPPRAEAADAETSKLILEALAGADWDVNKPGRVSLMSPQNTFSMLGLTPADGWQPPTDYSKFPDAAKAWLKEHAGTYRVKRLVSDPE
jgi:hypothetical protein